MRDKIYRDDAIKAIAVAVLEDRDELEAIKALPSADAEPSLKAIKRQIDEHWYLDAPLSEAVSRTSKGICAVCEKKQACKDGNRNLDMIACSRFELDAHYDLSIETI